MPNRIIRHGIIESEMVNSLSPLAELFYRRLFSIVDDYGRYDGHPKLLRVKLYGIQLERIKEGSIEEWMKECFSIGLISLYQVNNKPYVRILNFGQTLRAMNSQFPHDPNYPDDPKENPYNVYGRKLNKFDLSGRVLDEPESKELDFKEIPKAIAASTPSLIDQYFIDLPNSSLLREVLKRAELKIEDFLPFIPAFKNKASSHYKNFPAFVDHFKNWTQKELEKKQTTANPTKLQGDFYKKRKHQ